jgi:hypothetical protein
VVGTERVVPAFGSVLAWHWKRTGVVTIKLADTMPAGWQGGVDWQRVVASDNTTEIQAVETDRGNYLGYVRLVARRRAEAMLDEPIESVPTDYGRKALLRNEG